MFNLCAHMKWAHLPVAGGIADQDPLLLEEFEIIFSEIDKHHEEEDAKRKAEHDRMRNKAGSNRGSRMRPSRSR